MAAKRSLLVLPEAFGTTGGIQMFCRSLCLAAGRWASRNDARVGAVTLNDNVAPDPRYVDGSFDAYVGAGASKVRFVASYLKLLTKHRPDAIVVGHISLSPLALIPAYIGHPINFSVIAYGIEAWRPLNRTEMRALKKARTICAISEYTRDELLRHNPAVQAKTAIFPCSIDPAWSAPTAVSDPADPPMLLSVTRLERGDEYKGIDSVIRSL